MPEPMDNWDWMQIHLALALGLYVSRARAKKIGHALMYGADLGWVLSSKVGLLGRVWLEQLEIVGCGGGG